MVRDEIQIQAEFKAKVAKTMLANGLSVDLVSEYTGLSIEQVESLK